MLRMKRIPDDDLVDDGRGLSLGTGASWLRLVDRRVLRLGADQRRTIIAMSVLGLVVSSTYVAQGLLVAGALARILDGGRFGNAAPFIAGVAITIAVRSVMVWVYQTRSAAAAGRIASRLRRDLYAKVAALGPGWTVTRRSGTIQTTLVDGVEQVESYFRLFVAQLAASLLTAAGIITALVVIDPLIGVVVGVLVVVAAAGPALSWRLLGTRLRHWWTVSPALVAEYVDTMQGIATLKMFGASKSRGVVLERKADEVLAATMSLNNVEHAALQPFGLAQVAAGVSAIWLGVVRLDAGLLSGAELLVILMLASEALRPVQETKRALHFAIGGMGAAEGVLDILEARPLIAAPSAPTPLPASQPSIAFDDVTFTYRPGDRPALDGLTFAVEPGQTVALVGRSGAGKTTVASLLLRFFDPQLGTIRLGGIDLGELDPAELRRTVALVPQDTYLFAGTIAENLRLARPDATDDELVTAAVGAAADAFIDALPDGYGTEVGERGVKLSGGERQRIAIARALLADAPVLVLDEATASVDVASERIIQGALARLSSGRTVLVIAHRLSTVRHADRIVVVDQGRVVEQGTHTELAGTGGRYRELLRAEGEDAG